MLDHNDKKCLIKLSFFFPNVYLHAENQYDPSITSGDVTDKKKMQCSGLKTPITSPKKV